MVSKTVNAGPGWVSMVTFNPVWPDPMSAGGILLTENEVTGRASHSHGLWGRVYVSGSMAGRTSCEPTNPELAKREKFPLEHGTWVFTRNANLNTVHNRFETVQTHDVILHWPPERTWKSIVEEIRNAALNVFPGVTL